ncbi:MAG: hypothetical protein CMH83_20520 [Nocardioides sp.]|nr:hypothetical protein [Nocardioides sp.]
MTDRRAFAPGELLVKHEGVLAVELYDGAPFTFPPHPSGHLHPWAPRPAWLGPTALQLRRPGDWYSDGLFLDPVPGQSTTSRRCSRPRAG